MSTDTDRLLPRILLVDDNPAIHEDYRKILCPARRPTGDALSGLAAELFGDPVQDLPSTKFEVASAFQGQEALEMVQAALAAGRPFALAFMDVRMPPGWDGVETITRIWQLQPDLQVIICTAFSDYSREAMLAKLGESDSFVVLKKPFDTIEVSQLAHALTRKWQVTRQANARLVDLDERVRRRTEELVRANELLQGEISRRGLIEGALRESEERFHHAFDNVAVGLAIFRVKDQTCTDANESLARLAGCAKSDLLGRRLSDALQFSDPEQWNGLLAAIQTGCKVLNGELELRRRDGTRRQTLISIEPLTLGGDACYLASLADVTEQRRLETQLRQSQKMEAIGQLAAGVAHDFNNLLTIIEGYTSLQLSRSGQPPDVTKAFEQIDRAANRASSLTRQLLAFSRKQMVQRKPLRLGNTISRMQSMLGRLLGETIQLDCNFSPNLPPVWADESNLEQVVMNLMVNARDAMPRGGSVSISASVAELSAAQAARLPEAHPGRFVEMIVADTGCGMDSRTLSRVFEPFFTTKPLGKGTGLGLATVYGIVKQHDGFIDVESLPRRGTTFHVYLPVCDPGADELSRERTAQTPEAKAGEGETVLVVEDESAVREYVCTVLVANGYRVLEASCGTEALAVWQGAKHRINLLFTDMVMPNGLTGSMLTRRLLQQDRELRVVYTSGYSAEVVASGQLLEEGLNFLPKPFDQQRLLSVVRRALDSPPNAVELPPVAS